MMAIRDGRFFAWLGQFQWVRRLGILDTQMIFSDGSPTCERRPSSA